MKNSFFITILLAIAFGLLAGLAGQIISRYYFSQDLAGFALTREFDFLAGRSNIIIRDPRKVVVSQDAKIEETRAIIDQSLYQLFNLSLLTDQYLSLNNPLGLAMTVSSDGWLMAVWPEELSDLSEEALLADLRLVGPDRSIYEIESIVIKETEQLKLLFLKALDLSGAVVVRGVTGQELIAGQSLLVFKGRDKLSLASLVDQGPVELISSSETFDRQLSILAPADFLKDSFVYNLAGDFVGLIDQHQQFQPAPSLAVYWRSLLSKQEIAAPYLGLHYLNLSTVKFLENNFSRGALIYGDQLRPAIVPDSPAELAGLKAGDIISQVNGQTLNEDWDLATIILSLNQGEQVFINYFREGEAKEVSLFLDKK